MTKTQALARVRAAVVALADAQNGPLERFREANAELAVAQLDAAKAGARTYEIAAASEWAGGEL